MTTVNYQLKRNGDEFLAQIEDIYETVTFQNTCHKEIYGNIKYTIIS